MSMLFGMSSATTGVSMQWEVCASVGCNNAQRRLELTAQVAFAGRAIACQGAGCVAGTWTRGPCLGRFALVCCLGFVVLVFPSEFSTFWILTAASAVTKPRSSWLASASMPAWSNSACGLEAEAAPRRTANSTNRSMVFLRIIHGDITQLLYIGSCCASTPGEPWEGAAVGIR